MGARTVMIFLFEDVEVLDFCGPFEVFSVANELAPTDVFRVVTVAAQLRPVRARNGLSVNPDLDIAGCPVPDLLIIPGGKGTRPLVNQPATIEWIRRMSQSAERMASVCTGALLLGKAGLLDGLTVTTHHRALDLLREIAPSSTAVADRRFVDNGRIITSGGIAAGIDMSLYLVESLEGLELAKRTAEHMEYPYRPATPSTS
ncbi:Isonitrile hydratase [Planctomycetes bacterium Pan216]|uniref:Isonitrile hydratase n=1 Tax=Kolteria novifilia TaxID=2527975 RepID=A0A518BBZ4_9BACT|nr:Isonitrile hydratase [Planctomycetes bacterium Pan216]